MRPPIFVWKSGTLDVCDSRDELDERYPPSELAQENVVVCDSRGRPLWISRAERFGWANAVEGSQPPSPDLLRSILWKYLEGCGTPPQEIESLSLRDLVAKACPADPLPGRKVKEMILGKVLIGAFALLCIAVAMFLEWLRG